MTDDAMKSDDLLKPFMDEFGQSVLDNDKIIAQYDDKYLPKPLDYPLPWHSVGEVTAYDVSGNVLILESETAFVRIAFLAPEIVHVRVQLESDDFSDYFSNFVEIQKVVLMLFLLRKKTKMIQHLP